MPPSASLTPAFSSQFSSPSLELREIRIVLYYDNCGLTANVSLFSKIHIIPLPINHSKTNTSSLHTGLCNNCNSSYRALEKAYKKITESDALDYKVCADVSASVSMRRTTGIHNNRVNDIFVTRLV